MRALHILLVAAVFCWQSSSARDVNIPTATNIKVLSINFKTILEWEPKPTNYTYTVMLKRLDQRDWIKKCIHTMDTTCDVSDIVSDPHSTYEFRVSSEVQSATDIEEFPYTEAPAFDPYEQTTIGRPVIRNYTLNRDTNKLTVVVKDALTPYKTSSGPVTVRNIFQNDFKYTVFYRKASSTGQKQQSSSTNEIVINTDKGEDYCFYVQASVPSRKRNSASEDSNTLCTSSGEDFDIVILVAVGIAVALIVLIIVLSVILCKCRNGKKDKSKESKPLNDV